MEILAARYVLPVTSDPIENGAIAIDADEIVAVGTQNKLSAQFPDAPLRKFEKHALLPGLIDAHACLDMSLFPAEEMAPSFVAWQLDTIEFRQSQSAVRRRSAILEGLHRALANGTTTVADTSHYSGILEMVQETGLRLQILPELLAAPNKDHNSLYSNTFTLIDKIIDLNQQRIRPGIAPYAPYALSRNLLKIIAQQAASDGLPVAIQVARSFAEMEFFFESKGEIAETFFPKIGWEDQLPLAQRKTPIQYLDSIGFLVCRPALIGCTHLAEPDFDAIKVSGSKVVHSPATARQFDLGMTPVKRLRSEGIPVGLGTDSVAACLQYSLWDVMRMALKDHGSVSREAVSASELLRMATHEGAKAVGLGHEVGALETGKKADLIVVETNPGLTLGEVPHALVNRTRPENITKVFVEGQALK